MAIVLNDANETPIDQNGYAVVDIGAVQGVVGGAINTFGAISNGTFTATPLAANGVYTSTTFGGALYPHFRGEVVSDVAGTLALQAQLNGIWYQINSLAVAAGVAQHFEWMIGNNGISYRLQYTNGATIQTVFYCASTLASI